MAAVQRVATALNSVGRPLSDEEKQKLAELQKSEDDAAVIAGLQKLLDPHCLT